MHKFVCYNHYKVGPGVKLGTLKTRNWTTRDLTIRHHITEVDLKTWRQIKQRCQSNLLSWWCWFTG